MAGTLEKLRIKLKTQLVQLLIKQKQIRTIIDEHDKVLLEFFKCHSSIIDVWDKIDPGCKTCKTLQELCARSPEARQLQARLDKVTSVREQILRTLRNFTAELGDELKEAMDVMGDLQLTVIGKKNKPAYKVAGPKMTSLAVAEKLCQYTFALFRSSSELIEQVQKLEA